MCEQSLWNLEETISLPYTKTFLLYLRDPRESPINHSVHLFRLGIDPMYSRTSHTHLESTTQSSNHPPQLQLTPGGKIKNP